MNSQGDVAEVPLVWLSAQDGASRLLAHSQACWPQASFEYRAVHDVLALTLLCTCPVEALPGFSSTELGALRALVEDDVEWAVWCQGRLDAGTWDLPPADRILAGRAFHRLSAGRLLAGSVDEALGICAATAAYRGAGVRLGVTLARRLLDP
ncbi:hypothetical protein ACIOWI_37810 [Streptomyces sp. NPDC087659]|uniref:hypothetical protein n=1 Tax=Streptomyces sp. NPDC087659 TaxID=3365801 RepID=UPI003828BBEE